MRELSITKEYAGGRMDKLLSKYLDRAPQGFLYKMLRKKNIVLNGKKAKGSEILQEGDVIRIYLAEETVAKFQHPSAEDASEKKSEKGSEAQDLRFREWIVYEDEDLIALNKPAGLLTQKAKEGDASLNDALLRYLKTDDRLFTPGISNRLDRNTTGLVLAGKHPAATRELNRAIKERCLDKFYLCLVKGVLQEEAVLDGYLVKDAKTNTVRIQPAGEETTHIRTAYRPLAAGEDITLLEVELITGKSHQIRAHLASIGHPILGDIKYGDKAANAVYNRRYGLARQLLHARRVAFKQMEGCLAGRNGTEILAPLPKDMERIVAAEFPDIETK